MPKEKPTEPKPVVKPSAGVLVLLVLVLLGAGLALLFLGTTEQHTVASYFCFALVAAIVTFGFLGASGFAKSRTWQLGGSAGAFVVILGILLPFARSKVYEIKGTLYVDGAVATQATVALLETDRVDSTRKIGPDDNGRFAFVLLEAKKEYKFRVTIPDKGDTNITVKATSDWIELRVDSRQLSGKAQAGGPTAAALAACQADAGSCTLFLFNYLHDQVSDDELEEFQNCQSYRLDAGIRNHLSERGLLEGTAQVRVKRCTALEVRDPAVALQAATFTRSPAVLWGYLRRTTNQLVSATTVTLPSTQPISLYAREMFGNDVTELLNLDRPLTSLPLAVATYVLGDDYLKRGRQDLARKAFLHARELAAQLDHADPDFLSTLDARLAQLQSANAAAGLTPLGGP